MNEISIKEAERYIANAKAILKEKAVLKPDNFYTDSKYVKMASNTAWNGVLVAMQYKMGKAGFKFPPHGRKNVDIYRGFLAKNNKSILNHFNSSYNYLHLFGGYDGDLRLNTSKEGLLLAKAIIEWCKS